MSTTLFSDLDRTLLYSVSAVGNRAAHRDLVSVERVNGQHASFVTPAMSTLLADLIDAHRIVPITTRSTAQYLRIRFPSRAPRFALVSLGASLLCDGVVDGGHAAAVRRRLAQVDPLPMIRAMLERDARPELPVRDVDEVFCYSVAPSEIEARELHGRWLRTLAPNGWTAYVQGRKVYAAPVTLSKSWAMTTVAERMGVETSLAAGDADVDADLIGLADHAMIPAHGDLASRTWDRNSVTFTASTGMDAGHEILSWARRLCLPS